MTANVYREDRERARLAGMNDFVAKPVDPEVLFEAVSRFTGTKPRAGALAQSADPQAALRQRLAGLEGFDVVAGLRSVRGNWTSYVRMLRLFARERSREARTLAPLLAAGRRKDAERLAHTVKGVAATLGATGVSAIAGRLERLLREGEPDAGKLAPAVAQFEDACAQIAKKLAEVLPADEGAASAPIDAAHARAALNDLEALLAGDDVRAGAYFTEHAARIAVALGPVAEDVGRHIAAFQFDEALALLRDAGRAAGAGLPT